MVYYRYLLGLYQIIHSISWFILHAVSSSVSNLFLHVLPLHPLSSCSPLALFSISATSFFCLSLSHHCIYGHENSRQSSCFVDTNSKSLITFEVHRTWQSTKYLQYCVLFRLFISSVVSCKRQLRES